MKKILLAIICVTISLILNAEENKVQITKEKEKSINLFVNYFFNENEKGIDDSTSGELNVFMKSYFWTKKTIQDEKKKTLAKEKPWEGKIEILSGKREKILHTVAVVMESEEDVFMVRVNGKIFSIVLDKDLKVMGINEEKENNKQDKGREKQ